MKNGYWVIRTYEAGSVGEKIKFWVDSPNGVRPKLTKKQKSDLKKQMQNEASAERQVARLINGTFGQGDYLLGLDYSSEGMDKLYVTGEALEYDMHSSDETYRMEAIRAAAEKELRLFLKRVRRELEKTNMPFQYIAITSDMDGATGESVRIHHHLLIKKAALDACMKKWPYGGVDYSPLSNQADFTPIAKYLMDQVRKIPDAKKYIPSRNLIRPEPRDRIVHSAAEVRVPRGGTLLHRNEFKPGRPQYIRFILPFERE